MATLNGKEGVWRTVGGRRIFIENGEDLKSAMKRSGKFDSILKNKVMKAYHVTRGKAAAESIRKEGFKKIDKLDNERYGVNEFGDATYLSLDKKTTDYYKKLYKDDKPILLEMEVDTSDFITLELNNEYSFKEKFISKVGIDKPDHYVSKLREKWYSEWENKNPNSSLDDWYKYFDNRFQKEEIMTRTSGLIIYDNSANNKVGGNQLVVYDRSKIKNIK